MGSLPETYNPFFSQKGPLERVTRRGNISARERFSSHAIYKNPSLDKDWTEKEW